MHGTCFAHSTRNIHAPARTFAIPMLRPFILLISVLAFSATTIVAQNVTDAKGHKQGPWSKKWESGAVRYTGQFKDDLPFGEFKHFDEDGLLTTVQIHAGDGRISRAEHFRAEGTLMAKGKYVDQKKDSTWNYYGFEGGLNRIERYKNGSLEGEQVTYYPNGSVAEKQFFVNGVQQGESESWFENGKLKSEATYVNGEPEGKMVFYFSKGQKEIEGSMVNGNRDGQWIYFNEDGSIQLVVLYAKGTLMKERKENGTFSDYYDDEQLKSEITYKKGQRQGPFTEYYDNGTWELKTMPADEIRGTPPEMERILVGQSKKRTGTYLNDLLEGDVKEYDESGKLVRTTRYVGGEEVK